MKRQEVVGSEAATPGWGATVGRPARWPNSFRYGRAGRRSRGTPPCIAQRCGPSRGAGAHWPHTVCDLAGPYGSVCWVRTAPGRKPIHTGRGSNCAHVRRDDSGPFDSIRTIESSTSWIRFSRQSRLGRRVLSTKMSIDFTASELILALTALWAVTSDGCFHQRACHPKVCSDNQLTGLGRDYRSRTRYKKQLEL